MTTTTFSPLEIETEFLINLTDEQAERVVRIYISAIKRERNILRCARDGHEPNRPSPEGAEGCICDRCLEVIDQPKWDKFMAANK